jgi:hypothetical protein
MIKCRHGVYDPSGTGKARYCDGCNPRSGAKPADTFNPEETPDGRQICPKCGGERFRFKSEANFRCPDCGYEDDLKALGLSEHAGRDKNLVYAGRMSGNESIPETDDGYRASNSRWGGLSKADIDLVVEWHVTGSKESPDNQERQLQRRELRDMLRELAPKLVNMPPGQVEAQYGVKHGTADYFQERHRQATDQRIINAWQGAGATPDQIQEQLIDKANCDFLCGLWFASGWKLPRAA